MFLPKRQRRPVSIIPKIGILSVHLNSSSKLALKISCLNQTSLFPFLLRRLTSDAFTIDSSTATLRMKCHTNVNSTPPTQLPHTFSYIVAIFIYMYRVTLKVVQILSNDALYKC
jgi:hypothetical protein